MAVPLYRGFGFDEDSIITFDSPIQARRQVIMLRLSSRSSNRM